MKEVFIKYNPYKLETEVKIDGQAVKKNSFFNVGNKRLQEWVESMPEKLVEECSSKEFELTFNGLILDYEDVTAIAAAAKDKNIIIKTKHIPAKEIGDKEKEIANIFEEIQNGPFEELKQPNIIRAFEQQRSKDFSVNVIATMSAGKSTLINALLGKKLMPAKQQACTATITRIKDNDNENFVAYAYDSAHNHIATHNPLTLEDMTALNENENVSTIDVEGNIPFVDSDDVSLVLVDTPGPNNSRDIEHQKTTYRVIQEESMPLVLYVLNASQLGVNDDNALLTHVAQNMKVGGKQSKDRFIFVINKLDEYNKGEDSVTDSLEKVRRYLEDKGIENPNIFPASALAALDIRTVLKDINPRKVDFFDDPPEITKPTQRIVTMSKTEELHFEKYAPLTPSAFGEINTMLSQAKEQDDIKAEVLVHSGVISIEHAIRMYVAKYAKTAKVRNIVDTFSANLESARTMEKLKLDMKENEDKRKELLEQIALMETAVKNGEDAKTFKKTVEEIDYSGKISSVAKEIVQRAQKKIREEIEKLTPSHNGGEEVKLSKAEAELKLTDFKTLINAIQMQLQMDLESKVTEKLKENVTELLDSYKERVKKFSENVNVESIGLDPYKLINADLNTLSDFDTVLEGATKTEEQYVCVGNHKEYREVFGFRRFLNNKFGTNFNVDYDVVDDYDWVEQEYIDAEQLANRFFAPVEKELVTMQKDVVDYAKTQCKTIKQSFDKEFDKLDKLLAEKLEELKRCADDKNNTEESIKLTQEKVDWLEGIQAKVQAVLEI